MSYSLLSMMAAAFYKYIPIEKPLWIEGVTFYFIYSDLLFVNFSGRSITVHSNNYV
jgi:hypothetical protein